MIIFLAGEAAMELMLMMLIALVTKTKRFGRSRVLLQMMLATVSSNERAGS